MQLRRVPPAAWVVIAALLGALGSLPAAASTDGTQMAVGGGGQPWFGVLEPDEAQGQQLHEAGVSVVMLPVIWEHYETEHGVWNPWHLKEVRGRYADLRAQGFEVILCPGMQYPPDWVFELDEHTRFVNQHGDAWHGPLGQDVPNAVFNEKVRAAQAEYIRRLAVDLGDLDFLAVRSSGLPFGELRYPEPVHNGHRDSFWAFDAHAQASSPVPGWRPGDPGEGKPAAFLDHYLESLAEYGEWLVGNYHDAFGPDLPVTVELGSWGIRPGEIELAVAARLDGTSRGEKRETIHQGLDWARQFPRLAELGNVIVSSTWLDAADQGAGTTYESPIRYVARLAHPLGLPVIGENTGRNDAAAMQRSAERVVELGMRGMLWMRHSELFVGGAYATIDDYREQISWAQDLTAPPPHLIEEPGPIEDAEPVEEPGPVEPEPERGSADEPGLIEDPEVTGPSVDRPETPPNSRRQVLLTDISGDPHEDAIIKIGGAGITTGYDDGTFRPRDSVTRGQMATFLQRTLDLQPVASQPFSDVRRTPHAAGIGAVAGAGIATGHVDGTFRPSAYVTRGQMATFLQRAFDLPAAAVSRFPDAGGTHASAIAAVTARGIADGYPDGTFRQNRAVTRGQMASFLTRALDL
jgi:hypothetical protein